LPFTTPSTALSSIFFEVIVDGLAIVNRRRGHPAPETLQRQWSFDRMRPRTDAYRRSKLRDKEFGECSGGDLMARLRLRNETACVISASMQNATGAVGLCRFALR
jgi:hypothetical protein